MSRQFPKVKKERFRGSLRHYHRTGAKSQRSWDAWIDEKSANAKSINWLKVLGISIAVLALGGIIAGLIIEFF
jgi:hypothetical protein